MVEILVKYRTGYFALNSKAKDRIKTEIVRSLGVKNESHKNERAKELKDKFYSLDPEEKEMFQNKITYKSIVS